MRVIIAGSRGIGDPNRLNRAILAAGFDITRVVSGMCGSGQKEINCPDMLGVAWAKRQQPVIPVDPYPADWDALGKRAGMVRNCKMAQKADALIALWDGKSSGTKHMILEAVGRGLYNYIDATCMDCGGYGDDIALYKLQNDLRATCRPCLEKRITGKFDGLLEYFDVFGMWGYKHLHTSEKRRVPEEPKVPMPLAPRTEVQGLKFGDKPKTQQKNIRALPPRVQQTDLFEDLNAYVD